MYYVMIQTQVSTKYQVVIPKKIRRQIGLKPGQKLDIELSGDKIVLTAAKPLEEWKWPEDYLKYLPNPWEGEDSEKYLENERNSWD